VRKGDSGWKNDEIKQARRAKLRGIVNEKRLLQKKWITFGGDAATLFCTEKKLFHPSRRQTLNQTEHLF